MCYKGFKIQNAPVTINYIIEQLKLIGTLQPTLPTTRSHVTTLFISLHWQPIMARIRFKTLYWPSERSTGLHLLMDYIQSLLQPYTTTRHLQSSSDNRLVVPPLKSAWSSPVWPPQWCNHLPTFIRDTDCLPTFKKRLKTHLFREYNGT